MERQPEAHCCGPDHDVEFFKEISEVMRRFPALAGKYQVACVDHETDILNIDFSTKVAFKQIIGNTVVTEFIDRSEVTTASCCCNWVCPGDKNPCYCVGYWPC
jgi:hypothetical protein